MSGTLPVPNDKPPLFDERTVRGVLGLIAALGVLGNGLQAYTRPPDPVPSVPLTEYNAMLKQANELTVNLLVEKAAAQTKLDSVKPCKKKR